METMYGTMLQLPLFQGFSQEDFTSILGRVKLHFTKHKPGDSLLREGAPCEELIFLLKGRIAVCASSPDHSFSFTEYIQDTHLIEPYSMFGLHPQYTASYAADTEVNLLRIRKEYVVKDLLRYEIFRVNFVNYICNRTQILQKRIEQLSPNEVDRKIAHFILMRSDKTEGEKLLKIKMEDLARHLDDTRLNVSKGLNELQEKGLLVLKRKEIVVPDANDLFQWYCLESD